jgi:hypothetical protein
MALWLSACVEGIRCDLPLQVGRLTVAAVGWMMKAHGTALYVTQESDVFLGSTQDGNVHSFPSLAVFSALNDYPFPNRTARS